MEGTEAFIFEYSEAKKALQSGEFHIYFQPKIDMVTSRLYGAEALSRWIHPQEGLRLPLSYIDDFEKTGLIKDLDMYVLEQVCRIKSDWHREKKIYADTIISVNMSRTHLFEENFSKKLSELTDKYNISRDEIEIEITENIFIENTQSFIANLQQIKDEGFYISIDDFGSGFSGLNLLKDISVDTIKIDKGFLHGSGNTERGKSIIRNIIALCLDLKVDVVTEGIETIEQVEFIKKCGCQIAQGFYYSKPLPVPEFENFAEEYATGTLNSYAFHFDNSFLSDDGSLEAYVVGEGIEFSEGMYPGTASLHFPGGPIAKNVVHIPKQALVNESYTISLWINPEEDFEWTSVFYIRQDTGFVSIAPYVGMDLSCFRLWNARGMDGWHDIGYAKIPVGQWSHIAFTYNSRTNTMTGYVNGVLAGQLHDIPTNRYIEEIIIGGDNFKVSYKGYIDELIIYNEAKEDVFLKALYESYSNIFSPNGI